MELEDTKLNEGTEDSRVMEYSIIDILFEIEILTSKKYDIRSSLL
jgi:hypothetical protein